MNVQRLEVAGLQKAARYPVRKRRKPALLRVLVWAAAGITVFVMLSLIGYILIKGIPALSPELFAWEYTSKNVSMLPAIINTVIMTAFSLVISVPLGIFTAVYLTEYVKKETIFVKIIRIAAETLSGIPSIVYGLFGYLFFAVYLGWGYSMLSGAFTMAIMTLPLIMRTTEEAILAVPDMYREGSYGLGAGRLRTTFTIILPSAVPGILSGVVLATGRVVGETAALIFTAGTATQIAANPLSSARTLAVHMYSLASEGLHIEQAYAIAVVLLFLVLLINLLSSHFAKKLYRGETKHE